MINNAVADSYTPWSEELNCFHEDLKDQEAEMQHGRGLGRKVYHWKSKTPTELKEMLEQCSGRAAQEWHEDDAAHFDQRLANGETLTSMRGGG